MMTNREALAQNVRSRLAERAARIKERAKKTAKGGQSNHSAEAGYVLSAAVLAYFNFQELNSAFGNPSDLKPEDIDVLIDESRPVKLSDNSEYRMLSDATRRRVLKGYSREEFKQALDRNPARKDEPLQRAIDALVLSEFIDLNQKDAAELRAIRKARAWFIRLLDDMPDEHAIRRARLQADLLEPHKLLTKDAFEGRNSELKKLRDYIGVLPPSSTYRSIVASFRELSDSHERLPLVIHAPGGMGKSTLLAKLILQHAHAAESLRFPYAYVDFERTELITGGPMAVLLEIIRQIEFQSSEVNDELKRIRRKWTDFEVHQYKHTSPESIENHFDIKQITELAREFRNTLSKSSFFDKPCVIFCDTFERVQYHGEKSVDAIWKLSRQLQKVLPRVRLIISGRVPVEGKKSEELELEALNSKDALGLLKIMVDDQNANDNKLLQQVCDQIGGNPLSLKLAARSINKIGKQLASELDEVGGNRFLRWAFITDEKIQGQLYRRILGHIQNNNVRELAHPGLVLRCVDADIIRFVLAEPCGVEVEDTKRATELFRELSREVALVSIGVDGLLHHRPEIRSVMLEGIKREHPKLSETIQRSAIKYYAKKSDESTDPGTKSRLRAEELYHRMMLNQTVGTLNNRWISGVAVYLEGSYDELPPSTKAFLAVKLGRELTEEEKAAADLDVWEQSVARAVSKAINYNDLKKALFLLRERDGRSRNSPLYALEANVLGSLGRYREALKKISMGIEAIHVSADKRALLELFRLQAEFSGRIHQSTLEKRAISTAFALAKEIKDDLSIVENSIPILKLHAGTSEKEKLVNLPSRDEILSVSVQAYFEVSIRKLRQNSVMSAEFALWSSDHDNRVLLRAIESINPYSMDTQFLFDALQRLKPQQIIQANNNEKLPQSLRLESRDTANVYSISEDPGIQMEGEWSELNTTLFNAIKNTLKKLSNDGEPEVSLYVAQSRRLLSAYIKLM